MEMARGNRAIRDHGTDGRELHLFQKTERKGYYEYLGRFRYVAHHVRRGPRWRGGAESDRVYLGTGRASYYRE